MIVLSMLPVLYDVGVVVCRFMQERVDRLVHPALKPVGNGSPSDQLVL